MLRAIPRCERYRTSPCNSAFSRHPTRFRPPYRPTELETCRRFIPRICKMYMRCYAKKCYLYIYCDIILQYITICLTDSERCPDGNGEEITTNPPSYAISSMAALYVKSASIERS